MQRTGDPVIGETCPWCHQETVVYNGNYFCTDCEWAMDDDEQPTSIIRAYLLQCYYQAWLILDQAEMNRMLGYLKELR